ncbi:MAG: peptidase T [Oscillospiraceae bacterium]|nr:peptidase T [Oscillospiraceae bacterium]
MTDTVNRFLRYVKIDTQSEEGHETTPSTAKQFDLARLLVSELEELGAKDVYLDEQLCYVYAKIPSNTDNECPKLGFIAHMDTSPAVSDENVDPVITENYDGKPIKMGDSGLFLDPAEYPDLLNYVGKTIICTDGRTLLGGDDKAGVAIIMSLVKYMKDHPEFRHGDVSVGFTPDEEVGMGVSGFDIGRFGADFAYTVDGGPVGSCDFECFNAASGHVTVTGRSIHPGSAKGLMKNALNIAAEFHALLPAAERPEYTERYEGFFHLNDMSGDVESAEMSYIIRDHDREKFEDRKKQFTAAAEYMNSRYGAGTVKADVRDSYFNMREIILDNFHLVENARQAYRNLGIDLLPPDPVRGGTDGATLSFRGLPCPNLSTGGHNMHGRYEYIAAESMDTMVEVCREILSIYSN